MKVLLTGATGQIGRAAFERLRRSGHEVTRLLRSSVTSAPYNRVVRATLGNDDCVERILAQSDPCDAIVHAAACINHDNSEPDLIRVNCLGTQQIVTIAELWEVASLVYISGLTVVGQPVVCPITETHETCPQTTYHATKLFGERLLLATSSPATACVSLRVTSPVGPGTPPHRLLALLVQSALRNRPLTLHGRGTRRQNYVDVRDISEAIVACVEHAPRGVFNIGGKAAISNLELAQTCIRLLDSQSKIEFSDTPDPADDEVWDVSINAANRAFGYVPRHDIAASIRAVAQQYARV